MNLRTLDISRNYIFRGMVTPNLCNLLSQHANLSILKLTKCELGSRGVEILAQALRTHKNLRELDLGYNEIGSKGIVALVKALPQSLTTLDLSNSFFDDESTKALADILRQNCNLRILNLICCDGLNTHFLFVALTQNRNLVDLDLYNCDLGENTLALTEALRENRTLTSLKIVDKKGEENSIIALANALRLNQGLTTLDISGNFINQKGAQAFVDALKQNRTLTCLKFSNIHDSVNYVEFLVDTDAQLKNNSPAAKRQERHTVLLGTHLRVGANSGFRKLAGSSTYSNQGGLLRKIFEYSGCMNRMVSKPAIISNEYGENEEMISPGDVKGDTKSGDEINKRGEKKSSLDVVEYNKWLGFSGPRPGSRPVSGPEPSTEPGAGPGPGPGPGPGSSAATLRSKTHF